MNCARCKYNTRIEEARADPSKELTPTECATIRAACRRCNPENLPHGANGFTHIDFTAASGSFALAADYAASRTPSEPATQLKAEIEDAVRVLVAKIAQLDLDELGVFWGLLRGQSYSEIAATVGRNSRQSVLYRIKQIVAAHPWMDALRPKH